MYRSLYISFYFFSDKKSPRRRKISTLPPPPPPLPGKKKVFSIVEHTLGIHSMRVACENHTGILALFSYAIIILDHVEGFWSCESERELCEDFLPD